MSKIVYFTKYTAAGPSSRYRSYQYKSYLESNGFEVITHALFPTKYIQDLYGKGKKNWLILIDELFKGTNVEDAMKCSTAVIEGLRKIKPSLFILSTHLYEIGDNLKQYANIQFKYFETSINDGELVFNYQLKEGISDDRLGYLILKREGVVDLLQNL